MAQFILENGFILEKCFDNASVYKDISVTDWFPSVLVQIGTLPLAKDTVTVHHNISIFLNHI